MINLNYVFHFNCCGYYCLKYILKKEKINRVSYMSLYDLKCVLNKYDYSCYCFKVWCLDQVKKECITLVKNKNSYHYVVIIEVKEKYVLVYDPLFLLLRKIKKDKFSEKWSKICLFYKRI